MSNTQPIANSLALPRTFSAPDGRMIHRDAPITGEYVLLEDYQKLQKECDGLREELIVVTAKRDAIQEELVEYIRGELKREDPKPLCVEEPAVPVIAAELPEGLCIVEPGSPEDLRRLADLSTD